MPFKTIFSYVFARIKLKWGLFLKLQGYSQGARCWIAYWNVKEKIALPLLFSSLSSSETMGISPWMEGAPGGTVMHYSISVLISAPGKIVILYIHSWQQEMEEVIMNK